MNRIFKIHCSQIGKIMGRMGLTEKQEEEYNALYKRKNTEGEKPLTKKMEADLAELQRKKDNPELPSTATTFLKQWYAGEREEIYSRYIDKGNYVESDLIEFMGEQLGFDYAVKNQNPPIEDEYFIGTCDVELLKLIVDTKAAWDITTLHAALNGIDPDHEWQGRGYMRLYNKPEFIVFTGLMNTPAECNYDREVIYDHIPANERWVAYKVYRTVAIEMQIIDRVKLCRKWLEEYDKYVKSLIGRTHTIEQLKEKYTITPENERALGG